MFLWFSFIVVIFISISYECVLSCLVVIAQLSFVTGLVGFSERQIWKSIQCAVKGCTGRSFLVPWIRTRFPQLCDLTYFVWPWGEWFGAILPVSHSVFLSCVLPCHGSARPQHSVSPLLWHHPNRLTPLVPQPERMMETDIFWEASYITETADFRQTTKSDNKACESHYILWRFKGGRLINNTSLSVVLIDVLTCYVNQLVRYLIIFRVNKIVYHFIQIQKQSYFIL